MIRLSILGSDVRRTRMYSFKLRRVVYTLIFISRVESVILYITYIHLYCGFACYEHIKFYFVKVIYNPIG